MELATEEGHSPEPFRQSSLDKMAATALLEERKPSLTPPAEEDEDGEGEDDGEDEEYDDLERHIPTPPDGGWGWVIVFASFMCNLIVDGISYSFGVFFGEFDRYFGEGKSKTAWVGSLLCGCYLSVGPIVSALTNRYGCRRVAIAGGLIACTAFLLSQFSQNVDALMLTYGVMGGCGFGLIYLPAIVSVGYYFEKKRAFATGLAVCGSGVGTFIFAPLSRILLDEYGWKGANTILAGFILNCIIMGSLMRPLEPPPQDEIPRKKPLLQRMAEEKKFQMERGSICGSSYFTVQLPDGTYERRPKFNMEPGVHSIFNLDQYGKIPETPINPPLTPLPTITEGKADISRPPLPTQNNIVNKDATAANSLNAPSVRPIAPHQNSLPKNYSTPALEGMTRRPTILMSNASLFKMTQSNVTMDGMAGDLRKQSIIMRMSSKNLMAQAASRNNNRSSESVWVKVSNPALGSSLTVQDRNMTAQAALNAVKAAAESNMKPEKKVMARPLYRKDIFYSGSIVNLPEYKQSQQDLPTYRASVMSIPKSSMMIQTGVPGRPDIPEQVVTAVVVEPPPPCCTCIPPSIAYTIGTMLDCSLLSDPVFLLTCVSNIFSMCGFYVPFMYLTDLAILNGIDRESAAFLLSIIGIVNTFGRLFFGWLSDKPKIDALFVNNVTLLLSGVCILLIPFATSYVLLVIMCILFGWIVAAYCSLTSIILVDLLGLDKLTNAFGLLILFRGGASIVGPPLAGSLYDATGSYNMSFYAAGGLFIISAFLGFAIPVVKHYVEEKNRPKFTIEDDLDSGHQGETNV